ncbi:MAG: oligosaccharide flippase family protein [Chitinophagaceae bacterium]
MSNIQKLAGQTIWYGLSSIAARFINYLLTPYLTYKFSNAEYGEMSNVYSFLPIINVLVMHGMETVFFRFSNTKENSEQVHSNTSISIIVSVFLIALLLFIFPLPIAQLLKINNHVEYVYMIAFIVGFDALSSIPFAKLRQEGKPIKFAFVRISGIIINIVVIYFFLSICPKLIKEKPDHWITNWYKKDWAIGYVLLANLIQAFCTFLLLAKTFLSFKFQFHTQLWKEMMLYGLPIIIAGLGGMINETFDRIMLSWWAPVATEAAAKAEVGIYSACYKLAILISLAVQAFKMGAEPFFFKQAQEQNAPKNYARVMKFFVIVLSFMFLVVALYINIWKHFIDKKMHEGLRVVPILLMANIFLGIYYNLSVWYKLGKKTIAGAYITLIGAAITILINYTLIPHFSYMACAWATFFCYGTMMVISYQWGQKNYYIPYATKKLLAYLVLVTLIFFVHTTITKWITNTYFNYGLATFLLLGYTAFVMKIEKNELKKMPIIVKLIQ